MPIIRDTILQERPVARTPVSPPVPGKAYEHAHHGYVRVTRVEDGMVVFKRPGPTGKGGYINTRQQPIEEFQRQTVDVS